MLARIVKHEQPIVELDIGLSIEERDCGHQPLGVYHFPLFELHRAFTEIKRHAAAARVIALHQGNGERSRAALKFRNDEIFAKPHFFVADRTYRRIENRPVAHLSELGIVEMEKGTIADDKHRRWRQILNPKPSRSAHVEDPLCCFSLRRSLEETRANGADRIKIILGVREPAPVVLVKLGGRDIKHIARFLRPSGCKGEEGKKRDEERPKGEELTDHGVYI